MSAIYQEIMKKISKFIVAILSLFILSAPAFAWRVTPVTPLFQAVLNGNLGQVKAAVSSGSNVNQRGVVKDSFGNYGERTPLILAAAMGQADTVKYLLQHGAKVNARARSSSGAKGDKISIGDSALTIAARGAQEDVIRALVTYGKGINFNFRDAKYRITALMFMAKYERLHMTKYLINHGTSLSGTDINGNNVLLYTIKNKSRATLDYLVSKGANINHFNNAGYTVLMSALSNCKDDIQFEFAKYFLTKKPKIDLQLSKNGFAAIHVAAKSQIVRGAKLVLENGANIDLQDTITKITPLSYALESNDMVAFLLKNGAKTEIEDIYGNTVLMAAVGEVRAEVIDTLVKNGAESNKRSKSNVLLSPLTTLAGHPNSLKHSDAIDAMKSILDNGGDVDFKNGQGLTALMCAARKSDNSDGYFNAKFLIKRGAKLNLVNNKGETALMLAAGAGNDSLVNYLIEKGADPLIKSGAGETVANYAKRAGSGTSYLESIGVKAVAPTIKKAEIVSVLLGKWTGFQDGLPQAKFTMILRKNGTYSFNSKLSDAVWKTIPAAAKKSMKRTIAAHKGKYTINGGIMIWHPTNAAPTSMHWKLSGGKLIIDDKIRLKK